MDSKSYFVGEHVWNFADFQTKYGIFKFKATKKVCLLRKTT